MLTTKTRAGGTLNDSSQVKLHANDFTYESRLVCLSDAERADLKQYSTLLLKSLDLREDGGVCECHSLLDNCSCWQELYSHSRHHFPFKNYIMHAFPILRTYLESSTQTTYLLECGCGTGSTLLPLIKAFAQYDVCFVGFDISARALAYFREHEIARDAIVSGKLHLFVYGSYWVSGDNRGHMSSLNEAAKDGPPPKIARIEGEVPLAEHIPRILHGVVDFSHFDFVLLIFVLSALPSVRCMRRALCDIRQVMRVGGYLLFRDYDVADYTFMRQCRRSETAVSQLHFVKGDGTTQTFFTRDFIVTLMEQCGFVCVSDAGCLTHHCNRLTNRKSGRHMDKVFLNGTFVAV